MSKSIKLGYYFLKSVLFGTKFPMAISIDVTNKCNLRCKHCYFFEQNHKNELSEKDLLKKVKEIKKEYPSIIHASWVGGEPLLRKNVVEEGMKLFPFNMVVTNGSIELPKWKNCIFNVSVDGTKEYYEEVRGLKIYDKVKEHANRNDIHVNIACVLNKKNYYCIEDLLKEWKETKIEGVNFNFYTPIKGISDDLWLNWEERDIIIKKLLKLRKVYGNFLMNPEPILKLMLSENSKDITSNCVVRKAAFCIDPMGNRKLPCVIGDKADCLKCGCIVPFFIESVFVRKQIKSLLIIKKGFFG